jgi:hypothetical protein
MGYSRCRTAEEFAETYRRLPEVVRSSGPPAGFCCNRFADACQETNGLIHADRRVKLPIGQIALFTRGSR